MHRAQRYMVESMIVQVRSSRSASPSNYRPIPFGRVFVIPSAVGFQSESRLVRKVPRSRSGALFSEVRTDAAASAVPGVFPGGKAPHSI